VKSSCFQQENTAQSEHDFVHDVPVFHTHPCPKQNDKKNLEKDQLALLFIVLYTMASFWTIENGDFRFLRGTKAGGVAASAGCMFSSYFLFLTL
jgi:hypothetical protein